MPIKRKDIQDLLELKIELKNQGDISPTANLIFKSLFTMINYQMEQIEGLKEENELLKHKIKLLDKKGKKTSENSSTPPSLDPNRKRGSRIKFNRNSGGQLGHKGMTLDKTKNPDTIIKHKLKGRCGCGRSLSKIRKLSFEERQVFDIEIRRIITAHRAQKGICKCGREHTAEFPGGVTNHTQYGVSAKSLAAYFCQYQLIPFERTQEIFNDIFDLSLCKGSVFNHIVKGSEALSNFKEWAKIDLFKSKINHADETGIQINKDRHHLHVLSNLNTTLIEVHKGRGKEAVEAMGIIPHYKGKLVHDCYAMYFGYPCKDIICNAHLIRELEYFCDVDKYNWSKIMKSFIEELYIETNNLKEVGRKKRISNEFMPIRKRYSKILKGAKKELKELINKKGRKQEPVVNLYLRMKKHKDSILLFAKDFKVPFTNNQAERDLRMSKVHQKISGCFRSIAMAKRWVLMRSYLSTLKKRKINVFEGIKILYDNQEKDPVYSILGYPG